MNSMVDLVHGLLFENTLRSFVHWADDQPLCVIPTKDDTRYWSVKLINSTLAAVAVLGAVTSVRKCVSIGFKQS